MGRLLKAAIEHWQVFASVGTDTSAAGMVSVRIAYVGTPITLVVARGILEVNAYNEKFVLRLHWMIPFAPAAAKALGYLLVRESLAPAMKMTRQAEGIGDERLDARLECVNALYEFGELGTMLNQSLARLQASFGRQQRFMADASHELRTPSAVVRGAADVAVYSEASTPAALREALDIEHGEGRWMTRIVDDLLFPRPRRQRAIAAAA